MDYFMFVCIRGDTVVSRRAPELKLSPMSMSATRRWKSEAGTSRGFRIDPLLSAVTLRAPAASREDSRPQAILKFHCSSSLDYRARHGLPVYELTCVGSTINVAMWKIEKKILNVDAYKP